MVCAVQFRIPLNSNKATSVQNGYRIIPNEQYPALQGNAAVNHCRVALKNPFSDSEKSLYYLRTIVVQFPVSSDNASALQNANCYSFGTTPF